jgi:hypothetical protein
VDGAHLLQISESLTSNFLSCHFLKIEAEQQQVQLTQFFACLIASFSCQNFSEWGSTTGNAATVAHSTKKKKVEKIP